MAGKPGRSGPPGHVHSRNNRGGRGGPAGHHNSGKSGLWPVYHERRVPAWVKEQYPRLAKQINAMIAAHADAIIPPGETPTPVQADLLSIYGTSKWLLGLCIEHLAKWGPFDADGKPTEVFSRCLPSALKRVGDCLPALKEAAQVRQDVWSGVFDNPPAANDSAEAAAHDAPQPLGRDATPNVNKEPCSPSAALDAAVGDDDSGGSIKADSVASAAWGGE